VFWISRSLLLAHIVGLIGTSLLSSHVCDEENDSKHDAKSADNDIADSKEVVGTSEDISCGKHEILASSE